MDRPQGSLGAGSAMSTNGFWEALRSHHCGVYFVRTLEGFIHNLNGPLQILWIRSEQMQQDLLKLKQLVEQSGERSVLEIIDRMHQRMESLVRGLDECSESIGFLNKDIITKYRTDAQPVDLNKAIQDVLFLLKADMFFKHQVETDLRFHMGLPNVKGRHSDFCVMMLHLIQNALEAMVEAEEKKLTIETIEEPGLVVVRVDDTGCGISSADGSRIFEPFFTTKKNLEYNGRKQKHVGLGLPLVSQLLESYKGSISCRSKPCGMTFEFRVPTS